jgi:AraC-like DNA-binding protein
MYQGVIETREGKGKRPAEVRFACRWMKNGAGKIPGQAFKLYCLLLAFANKDSEAWPKRETLAEAMGVSPRVITRLFSTLLDWSLIEDIGTVHRVTKWRVLKL